MIGELGHFSLMVALMVALVQGILPLSAVLLAPSTAAKQRLWRWARPACQLHALLVWLAFLALIWGFISCDFSIRYVADHASRDLPLGYRIAAAWGSHEGSMLLWVVLLSSWAVAVAWFSRALPEQRVAQVLAVLGLIGAGFISFVLFTSNPFVRLLPAAADGKDLNPLLQDIGMIIHPPLLYMGYVGFAVGFAVAVSALISGDFSRDWARWARPWTLAAWVFLTLGIAVGSGWAYYELGWGGWWFWDPVENASFLPWLLGTALIHSLMVTEKSGALQRWTLFLAVAAFSLSLLGTFLVRSGVLTSVHAFATDPRRGLFILLLLGLVVGGSLTLFSLRADALPRHADSFTPYSRESCLGVGNVLLLVVAASVLLGTLYPLILDALDLGKISVGAPYFETVLVPLMVPVVFLMGLAPWLRWRSDQPRRVLWRGLALGLGSGVLAGLLCLGLPHPSIKTGLGLTLALWLGLIGLLLLYSRRGRHKPLGFWGMWLAHLGVGVFVVGVTLVKNLESNLDTQLRVGEGVQHGGYQFQLQQLTPYQGPNYKAMRAEVLVAQGAWHTRLYPEKRIYSGSGMPMTEAALDVSLFRDVYVALGEPIDRNSWVIRVYLKPFIGWIWAGCALMALGGCLAGWDRRYRRHHD
jgi:cytochrome c-type biogenesis protein CcmF